MNKKVMKILTIIFYVFVVLLLIYGIYFFYTDSYSIYLMEEEVTLDVGSSYQMKIIPSNVEKFDYDNYIFSSKDKNIIEVNDHGEIKALKQGNSEVSVRFKNGIGKQKLAISVVNVEVTDLELEGNFSVNVNDTKKINVKVNNQDNISTYLTYKSEDETIAKVDAYGNVTGIKEGKTHITVTNGDASNSVEITVIATDIKIEEININENELNLNVGEKKTLSVNVVPSNASQKELEWSSSDTSVAKVDSNGTVFAISKGYAIISVKSDDEINSQITVYVNEEEKIILSNYNIEMEVGETTKLSANIPVKFTSSDVSIASIDQDGNIKALKAGKVTITASANNKKNTCIVVVSKKETPIKPTPIVEVKSIVVKENNIKLTEGDTKTLIVNVNPSDATNKIVKYTSEDSSIATINSNGVITAKKSGKTKIIITSVSNKNIKSEVLVTVKAKVIEVSSISLNTSSKTLIEEDKFSLVVTYVPQDATNKSVTWSSSDTSVATVDSNGKVTAKKKGSATITASTYNNKTASVKITVNKKTVDVTSVKINSNVYSVYEGDNITLSATVTPDNATNKKVTWSSSNTGVAVVDSNGVVSAIKSGSAKITVKSVSNPNLTDSKTITVNVKTIPVTKLSTDVTTKTLKYNKTFQWDVTVLPTNATNKQVIYSSSDTSIASVDSNGKITSKSKNGTATITAKSKDNSDKKVTVKVTVYEDKPLNVESGLKSTYFQNDSVYKDNLYIPKNAVENMPMLVFIPASDYAVSLDVNRLTAGTSIYIKSKVFIYLPNISYGGSWSTSLRKHINDIVDKYKINKNKISVTGCSTGGWYMYNFVAENKDLFSAILSTSTGHDSSSNVIKNNYNYFKMIPMKGYGETTSTSTWVNGKRCTGTTSGWNAARNMEDLFTYLGRKSDFTNVGEMCHSDVTDYAFSIDKNSDGKSDILEWLISQTKQ